MVLLFYTTYISVDLAHREIFHAKVGKGGINYITHASCYRITTMLVRGFHFTLVSFRS